MTDSGAAAGSDASGCDRRNPRGLPIHELFWLGPTEHALEGLPRDPRARILDAGFGDGGSTRAVAGRLPGVVVFGLDQSFPDCLRAAGRTGSPADPPGLLPVRGSIEAIPMRAASFDYVFCRGVLQYTDPSLAIPEMLRVLRPGGSLLLVAHLSANPFVRLYRSLRRDDGCAGVPVRGYLDASGMRGMPAAGTCTRYREHHLLSPLLHPLLKAVHPGVLRDLVARSSFALDRFLLASLPFLRRFAWMASMEIVP